MNETALTETRRQPPADLTPKMRKFLKALGTTMTVTAAAEAAEVDRSAHYQWLTSRPDYAEEFQRAKDEVFERLEGEAIRRAHDGVEKKLYHRGKPIFDPETGEQATERQYSDQLLQVLLRRFRPDLYGSDPANVANVNIQQNGTGTVREILDAMHSDPDYVEFIRQKTFGAEQCGPEPDSESLTSQETNECL